MRLASFFREALRRFFRFSEEAAARTGLTERHYQALLSIRARSASWRMIIGDLAPALRLKHNSTVGRVDRLVARGLGRRDRIRDDYRKVQLRLTRTGEKVLQNLASVHREELKRGRERIFDRP